MSQERAPAPVVLLAYHYPPSREVGAIRASRVAAALARAGHPVTVIRAGADGEAAEPAGGGVRVETVVPAASPREWYAAARQALRASGASGDAAAGAAAWTPPERVGGLKRLLLSLFWLPDDRQGFIWRAARAAAAALDRAGPGAVLYSSSPPHSAQVAALLAHWWTRAPWVMEMRDPWTDNPGKPWYCRTAATDLVERWLERECLRRARLVVGVSEGICRLVAPRRERAGGGPVLLVRNGIDAIDPTVSPRPPGPIRVLHAGTCYLGRDPRPFLGALAAVAGRRGLGPDQVQVELLGRCEWFDGVSMRQAAEELGVAELVRFTPWLEHAEARRRMQSADVLLLLAEGQPLQVPQKLYEYLGTGRRLLVFADPGGETARMTEAVGGHVVTWAAAPDLEAAVERALLAPPEREPDHALLAEWSAERQMGRLAEAVGRVAGPRAGR